MGRLSNTDADLFYSHSGKSGFVLPLVLMIGIPVVAALAALYAYVVFYCPIVGYVNILFLMGFVIANGVTMAYLAKWGRCRSPMMMAIAGVVVGMVGLYFAWVFFIKAMFGDDVSIVALLLDPAAVWKLVTLINDDGWWGPSGIAQWALSAIEAILVVGGTGLIAMTCIDREAFCEDCGTWCKPFETMHLEATAEILVTKPEKIRHLELLALDETEPDTFPRVDAEVLQCTGCKSTQAIRFKRVTQEMDDGKLKEQVDEIPRLLLQKSDRPLDDTL